jgi:hypothetical protein
VPDVSQQQRDDGGREQRTFPIGDEQRTVDELAAKLARWDRVRKQRLGCEDSEDELKEEFAQLDLPIGTHRFGDQELRVQRYKHTWLKKQDLIEELLARFGDDVEDLLATDENGETVKTFHPRFRGESEGKSYIPQGEADDD